MSNITSPILQRLLAALNEWIPLKAVFNWPTPKVADVIVSEIVDASLATFKVLPYGTKYNEVDRGPYTQSLPNHVLVFQATEGSSGRWIRRIWASNRVDQDDYNYAIEYPDGDPEYPRYTRVYVVPREGYEPLAPLSDDPDHPTAKLVSEQMINEVEPAELNSLYVKVVRVYETLPGPITTSFDYDSELNINVRTRRQVVASFVTPLADPPVDNVPTETNMTLELKESPRTKYTKIRVESDLLALPPTKIEYQTGRYPFPALVTNITVQKLQLTLDPDRSEVRNFPTMKAEPNVPALFKVETSFYNAPPGSAGGPPVSTLFVINPQNLIYRGISYQIAINNVLNNTIATSVSFVNDELYGNLSEGITFPASTPSASAYQALIGSYQIVGCDIQRFRGSLWLRVQQSVLLV